MAPTLTQVLSTGSHSASSFNLFYLAAGLLAALFAAVSVAKGVEIFRSGRKSCLADAHYREKTAKLSFMLDEIKLEKESVIEQNHELRNQLAGLSGALYDLKKSNLSIARENEKLRVEKEQAPRARMRRKKEGAGRKPQRVSRKRK